MYDDATDSGKVEAGPMDAIQALQKKLQADPELKALLAAVPADGLAGLLSAQPEMEAPVRSIDDIRKKINKSEM